MLLFRYKYGSQGRTLEEFAMGSSLRNFNLHMRKMTDIRKARPVEPT